MAAFAVPESLDTGGILDVGKILGLPAYNIFLRAGVFLNEGQYVYTDQSKQLMARLNKNAGRKSFCIKGAKGVGKTCALVFLAATCTRSWVFVTSRSIDLSVSHVHIAQDSLEPPRAKSIKSEFRLDTLSVQMGDIPDVHLFVDLSEWQQHGLAVPNNPILTLFREVSACVGMNIPVIIAQSTDSGLHSMYSKFLPDHMLSVVKWSPFSQKEAESLFKSLNFECSVAINELIAITCANPRLIKACRHVEDVDAMKAAVDNEVQDITYRLFGEVSNEIPAWVEDQLSSTYTVINAAVEGREVDKATFLSSWPGRRNLLYVSAETANGYTLQFSYPNLLNHLFSLLSSKYQGRLPPTVLGYYFEYDVLQKLDTLEIEYVFGEGQDEATKRIVFQIARRQAESKPQHLKLNTLYHLSYTTPAVDAIGKFTYENEVWLVLIQVSLSPYNKHKSKSGDAVQPGNDFMESDGIECKMMYLYISPHELLPSTLREHGIHTRTKSLYLGVPCGKTADTVSFIKEHVRFCYSR